MALPIWAALALIKTAGTGAGIAYSLYQRHKRETEEDTSPRPAEPPSPASKPERLRDPSTKPKGPVVIMLDDEEDERGDS
jgi:hypothetical protein